MTERDDLVPQPLLQFTLTYQRSQVLGTNPEEPGFTSSATCAFVMQPPCAHQEASHTGTRGGGMNYPLLLPPPHSGQGRIEP